MLMYAFAYSYAYDIHGNFSVKIPQKQLFMRKSVFFYLIFFRLLRMVTSPPVVVSYSLKVLVSSSMDNIYLSSNSPFYWLFLPFCPILIPHRLYNILDHGTIGKLFYGVDFIFSNAVIYIHKIAFQ